MRNCVCWLLVGLVAASGCKAPPPPLVEVEGVVRLDGRPLKRVQVRFLPKIAYGAEYGAIGETDEKGHYQMMCKGEPGACLGENLVLINEGTLPNELKGDRAQPELARYFQKLGGRPLPQKYTSLASENPLTVTIERGKKEYNFDLTR